MIFYYMMLSESLSLVILGIAALKFARVSRRLSTVFHLMERPAAIMLTLLALLAIIYTVFALIAN
jgi:hypothetical protein